MMGLPSVTIFRSGKFMVPNLRNESQCGKVGQKHFLYECEIQVENLDDKNFVCDADDIDNELQKHFAGHTWTASCEQLAAEGVHLAHQLCQGRANRIRFQVSPVVGRHISVEWNSECSLPTFRAEKTREGAEHVAFTSSS